MKHRQDNRSTATRIFQGIARGVVIAALGFGLCSLLGDVGVPARVLGVLGLLAATGTAVAAVSYVAAETERRREEERRSIELENQRADELLAERNVSPSMLDLAVHCQSCRESNFVQLVEEQRRQTTSGSPSRVH
jgi:hypothetical protein